MLLNSEQRRFKQIEGAFNYILDNPDRCLNKNKDIYEFGVYKGESLGMIFDNLDDNKIPYNNVFAIDSFEGLPQSGTFKKFQEGAYSTKILYGENYIEKLKEKLGLDDQDDYDWGKVYFVQSWYNELTLEKFPIKPQPAILVHIDCDLYQSTYDALDFMFSNQLINKNTLIAFDEFMLNDALIECEADAWWDIAAKYKVAYDEVFAYTYFDKDTGVKIRQNVIAIERIGNASTTDTKN